MHQVAPKWVRRGGRGKLFLSSHILLLKLKSAVFVNKRWKRTYVTYQQPQIPTYTLVCNAIFPTIVLFFVLKRTELSTKSFGEKYYNSCQVFFEPFQFQKTSFVTLFFQCISQKHSTVQGDQNWDGWQGRDGWHTQIF